MAERIEISDDWLPTAENINALPPALRRYVHNLETNADPAGMVCDNTLLRDQVRRLESKLLSGSVRRFRDQPLTVLPPDFTE